MGRSKPMLPPSLQEKSGTQFAEDQTVLYRLNDLLRQKRADISLAGMTGPDVFAKLREDFEAMRKEVKKKASETGKKLSNAFISVVVDGVDARRALDTAVKRINRETYRKLEEFGYYKDGEMLKEFPTPTVDVVQKYIDAAASSQKEGQE